MSEELTEERVDKWLKELSDYLEKDNVVGLKDLSNHLIEQAVTTKDKRVASLSLIAYGLSKLASKPHLVETKRWSQFKTHMLGHLEQEIKKPETKEHVEEILEDLIKEVTDFDKEAGNYIFDIIQKARIKQASRVYAMGASLSRAAEVTGASERDLLRYIGTTKIHDQPYTKTKKVTERYDVVKKIFEE
jgi:hypothetical protein